MVPALCVVLSGCLAQQADLNKVSGDLERKVRLLTAQEEALRGRVDQANRQIDQQKKDVDHLVSETRARLNQEITDLREQDLPKLEGRFETQADQLQALRAGLDDGLAVLQQREAKKSAGQDKRLGSLEMLLKDQGTTFEKRLAEQTTALNRKVDLQLDAVTKSVKGVDEYLKARDKEEKSRGEGLSKQLETQGKSVTEQMIQFRNALLDFQKVMTVIEQRVARQEQVAQELGGKAQRETEQRERTDAESKALLAHLGQIQTKMEADGKVIEGYFRESKGSFSKAIESVAGKMEARLDEQDRRIETLAANQQTLATHIDSLTQAVMQSGRAMSPSQESGSGGGAATTVPSGASVQSQLVNPPATSDASADSRSGARTRGEAISPERESSSASSPEAIKQGYDRSLSLFRQDDLYGALRGFANFLAQHPESALAPNAQYWIGECYYGSRDYRRAIEAFELVRTSYPSSEKVPAALLKEGFAYLALKDRPRAIQALQQVVTNYPKTSEAAKAADKLKQLKNG
jgi:tol-pal system protein YbgF